METTDASVVRDLPWTSEKLKALPPKQKQIKHEGTKSRSGAGCSGACQLGRATIPPSEEETQATTRRRNQIKTISR